MFKNLLHKLGVPKADETTSTNSSVAFINNPQQSTEQQSFPSDVEEELKAKNWTHFVCMEKSNVDSIVVKVYENESWHPILHTWGSVPGVHMGKVFDRPHLSDETGHRAIR